MEDIINTVEQEVESDLITAEDEVSQYYNSTTGNSGHVSNPFGNGIPVYPEETLAPDDCAAQLDADVKVFWDLVYSMAAFLIVTILLPYLLCCCYTKKFYRFVSWIYFVSGTLQFLCGLLLTTALLPNCPVDCGEFFCDLHKYNPGPIYGCFIMLAGLFWWCKGCWVRIQGKNEATLEQQAEYAKTAGTDEGTYLGEFQDTTDYDPEHQPQPHYTDRTTTTTATNDTNKLIPDIL